MANPKNETATDQPISLQELLQTPEAQQKVAQIREMLPDLVRLTEAFADLHELLDTDDLAGNFEGWCEREFGVNPELIREATDRLKL